MTTTMRNTTVPIADSRAIDYTLLRVALWTVCVYAGLGLLGFAVFAGF